VAYTTLSGVACLGGAVACGDVCVQLASNADNCGACGNACAFGSICDGGRCRAEAEGCSPFALLCARDCIDPSSDERHCGACAAACPSEATCVAGACACPGALTACGSLCVDTLRDNANCGACGTACVDTQTCEAGSCECPAGRELCSTRELGVQDGAVSNLAGASSCVDPLTDAQNCGGCGNVCSGGQLCAQGACACPAGQALCDGQCVDTETSADNCGGCGNVCSGGQVCGGGACACPTGQALCDGQCIDIQSDAAHCGACDVACGLGQACAAGSCQSGAAGDDGCQGLAQDLSISEVAAYQTVKVSLARDGQALQNPQPAVVAGRPTLFRVFVTPGDGWVQRELSARLFLQDGEAVLTQYSESTLSIAAASTDDDRATTFEFLVPPERVTGQTQFAVEVVECGTGSGAAQSPRFPATGGAQLGAVDTGGLKLHLVPLRANGLLPDLSDDALNLYRIAFLDTYPIASIEITVGDPVDIADPEDWSNNLDQVRALRQQQQPPADVYYYGLLKPTDTFGEFCGNGCIAGIGYIPQTQVGNFAAQQRAAMGLAYADDIAAFTMLHEVGHNHGRSHAPCAPGGGIAGVDPNFPQQNGSIGTYGYNALGDQLLPPDFTDLMGYCNNQWLSAYTYGGILDTVLAVNGVQPSVIVDPKRVGAWRVLLVDGARGPRWGIPMPAGSGAAGVEETARVLDAAGAVIDTVSVYRTPLSDTDAVSIEVPEPKPGWRAIQVAGASPIEFQSAP
jgi:hypothetical protein